jgi:hypothetical protein
MSIKYINIFQSTALKNLPKLDFWFENKSSGNPGYLRGWRFETFGKWLFGAKSKKVFSLKIILFWKFFHFLIKANCFKLCTYTDFRPNPGANPKTSEFTATSLQRQPL